LETPNKIFQNIIVLNILVKMNVIKKKSLIAAS